MSLRLVPVTLREANRFVAQHHRHHQPVRGCRFTVGVAEGDRVVGVIIVGRPVARAVDLRSTCEVTRCCTDGTRHAASLLYAAAARAARALGYERIQTYTLEQETGVSVRAAGWIPVALVRGRRWEHSSERQLRLDGSTRRQDQPTGPKVRWHKELAA
jgi:hypothetical protein